MNKLKKKYSEVYLLRNEKHFALYNFDDGHAFEPDFLLLLLNGNKMAVSLQLFLEPKGDHLLEHDKWKEDFLLRIQNKVAKKTLKAVTKGKFSEYRLIGLPFYNSKNENGFEKNLYRAAELSDDI